MRILFVADTIGIGGKERQLLELLKGLHNRPQIEFGLCLLPFKKAVPGTENLAPMSRSIIRKTKIDPGVFFKLHKLCKQFQPDLIQSWEHMCSLYTLPVAKLVGAKFLTIIRNAPDNIKPFSDLWIRTKLTFPFSDLVLANSFAGLKAFGINLQRGHCIYNGFDATRLRNLEAEKDIRARFDIKTDKVVGMVGKFHPKKDNETFIASAVQILQKRRDVTFVAVGDGAKLQKCKDMVPPELKNNVIFCGKQSGVESIVNVFNIGVLATFTEGISNSIMEYMALRKPVVATDGGGTSELVIDGKTGFLVQRSNPDDLADKLTTLLDDQHLMDRMGTAGEQRLQKHFNLDKMTDNFIDTYRNTISGYQPDDSLKASQIDVN